MSTITETSTAPVAVGTIYASSWGYEQTNVDFYEVTASSAKTVTLRPIGKRVTAQIGFMTEHVEPAPGAYMGAAFRRKNHGDGYVSIDSVAAARVWDGLPARQSHYA